MDLKRACEFGERIAREAGDRILMRYHGTILETKWSQRTHLKTIADDESDRYLREEIGRTFPAHNVLSEELAATELGSAYTWVVDPLDGTTVFTCGA